MLQANILLQVVANAGQLSTHYVVTGTAGSVCNRFTQVIITPPTQCVIILRNLLSLTSLMAFISRNEKRLLSIWRQI